MHDPIQQLLEGIHKMLETIHNPKAKWMVLLTLVVVGSFSGLITIYNHSEDKKIKTLEYKSESLKEEIKQLEKIQKEINTAIKAVRREFDNAQDLCKGSEFTGNLINYKRTRREILYDIVDANNYTDRVFGNSVAKKTADFIKSAEDWKLCSGEKPLYELRLKQRAITHEMDAIIRNKLEELRKIEAKIGIKSSAYL